MTWIVGILWIGWSQPAWLWAGLATILPVGIAVWNHRRGVQIRRCAVVLQSLALLLAAVSLAGPVVPFSTRPPRWLVFRDVSASVQGQNQELPLPENVAFDRFSFAGTLGEEERDETHLRPVLDWATWAVQNGRADGAILLTDGQFQDDWQPAARRYARTRAPLWIVPLAAPPPDARIESVTVHHRPSQRRLRSVATYDIRIRLGANAPTRRTVRLFRLSPGETKRNVSESEIVLEPNRPATIHMRDVLPRDSAGVWQAEISPHDSLPQNDTLQAAHLPVQSRIAWIGIRPGDTITRLNVTFLEPSEAPADLTGWLGYTSVVLADATGKLLSLPQRIALAEYVRSGGGLVLLGAGPHETPAERDDPLNQILPLRVDPFERNPLALTVVLDASGSMAEATGSPPQAKWSLAGQAILALREHLTPRDRLRVIVFSDDARTIFQSDRSGLDFAVLAEALQQVHPNGPTNITPALQRVLQTPPDAERTNLVLVLSDLQTAKFDPADMAKRFREQARRLAVVATGSASLTATPLARWAKELNAPLIHREHLQGLADVFGKLCRRARGEEVRRGDFAIRYESARPSGARIERIDAYVPAAAAPWGQVFARIRQTDDPLTVFGSAGWGATAVISAPPEALSTRPGGVTLLREVIARIHRPMNDPRYDARTTRDGERIQIRATVRDDGRAVNLLDLQADIVTLSNPAAEILTVTLAQVAPGAYEAAVPLTPGQEGALAVRVKEVPNGRSCRRGVVPGGYPREFARVGVNYETLRELQAVTGGRIVEAATFSSPGMRQELQRPRRRGRSIWRMTLSGALLAMLVAWWVGRRKTESV
ncbi:MAG: VWA domain-containing protein [Phycisphaerae bacterium]|nr:VWA domain-containing protein [Phycisphaerae bacterium]